MATASALAIASTFVTVVAVVLLNRWDWRYRQQMSERGREEDDKQSWLDHAAW